MYRTKGEIDGFSPIESAIMKSVWSGNNTTRTIYEGIPEDARKRLSFATTSTYLMRMVQKGYLKRTPTEGREYEFTACITQESLEEEKIEKINITSKLASQFLKRFARLTDFTAREREEMLKIAERVEKQGNSGKSPKKPGKGKVGDE